jgi:hypothetical protein
MKVYEALSGEFVEINGPDGGWSAQVYATDAVKITPPQFVADGGRWFLTAKEAGQLAALLHTAKGLFGWHRRRLLSVENEANGLRAGTGIDDH